MFDAHLHIIDPRFPLFPNHGYLPDPFSIDEYRARTAHLGITGGAVVTASYQNSGQDHLLAALKELGPGWVGVAQLDEDATDQDIIDLHEAGVRAVRFNLRRSATDLKLLTEQALRAWDLVGWHAEFYVDATLLLSLEPVFAKLPSVSIDHLGMSTRGLPYLLNLVDRGARVKATGFGRVSIADVRQVLRKIHATNPQALLFGTDLPGSRSRRVFEDSDIDIVREAIGEEDLHLVLEDNARAWYQMPAGGADPVLVGGAADRSAKALRQAARP